MTPQTMAALVALAAALAAALFGVTGAPGAQASGGGEISTDNPGEGKLTDFAGAISQAEQAMTPANFGNPQDLSPEGLRALMDREGFSAVPYPDHKGYSIGYGHLIKAGEAFDRITAEQGAELLASDVAWAVDAVRSGVLVPVAQCQFDALVSFCFNVGAGAFKRSTLLRRINKFDPGAADEFGRWVYASGQVNSSLVARREGERTQFGRA